MTTNILDALADLGINFKSGATFPKHIKAKTQKVDLLDLEFDYDYYQRAKNTPHIRGIYRGFDVTFFMVPLVMKRKWENDKLVVVDGQQRVLSAASGGTESVDCIVLDSYSLEDEAKSFIKINAGRKAIPPAVLLRAKATTGDAAAITFIDAVEYAGFTSDEKAGHLRLKAVTGVKKAAKTYGYSNITKALLAYKAIWPNHSMVHADVVRGLAYVCWAHENKPTEGKKISAAEFAKNLSGFITYDLIATEVRLKKVNHNDRDWWTSKVIAKAYNKQAKGRSALSTKLLDDARTL